MANDDRTKIIPRRTPESAAMLANVKRAMTITANLNRLTFNDADEVRALFSDLIGKKVDDSFLLIPPFYATGGADISVGRNVFINQNCTFYDLGGIDIADDVMIGPNVSIITSGHPVEPSRRRAFIIAKPIVIERNVWIAAGATIIGGVTVGEKLGCCGGLRSHQERSPEYSCRRKSGEGHSFDCRLRARLFCVSQNSPIFDLKSPLQQSCFLRGTRAREGNGGKISGKASRLPETPFPGINGSALP